MNEDIAAVYVAGEDDSAERRREPRLAVTPDGRVRGRRIADVSCYSAIPYAAPPTGARRFRPPSPVRRSLGELDATSFPPAPVQEPFDHVTGTPLATSEDCLYLNVWTPTTKARLPVIVWLYGGGFESGSASPPRTDGAGLARHGAVVVSINHRVGALGFTHLAGVGGPAWETSTNLGLQDIVAGLRWVRTRIGAFGGDPDNVTLAGQSSGGFSVGALLAMPSAVGLFDKVIMQSGATTRTFSSEVGSSMAEDLMREVGADGVDDLRQVSADALVAAQQRVADRDIGARNRPGGRSWGTVVDGVIVAEEPQLVVARGGAAHIPIVVGATTDEVRLFEQLQPESFAPASESELLEEFRACVGPDAEDLLRAYRDEQPRSTLGQLRSRFLTDWIYRVPAAECAHAHEAAGGAAWLYEFAYGTAALGAHHGIDVPFVLDRLDDETAADPAARATRDDIVEAWLAFATSGDPGWPRASPHTDGHVRRFGGGSRIARPPGDSSEIIGRALRRSAPRQT